ncbi:MAG: nucleotide exchange factor GrpE [Thermodesulfobacteriota bacterium]|nr:nucleotide exchange factor GrpE [Thermodesulfobacteriota bacterium]
MSIDDKATENKTEDVKVEISKEALETQKRPLTEKSVEELAALIKEKEQEAIAHYDRMLRMAAELENYKKRAEREKAEHIKYANESLAKELLSILDNLERAAEHAKNDDTDKQALLAGVEMVLREFMNAMEKFGLKAVDACGQVFDPQYHEAVMVEENDSVEDNTILNELQKGYIFKDRLLRPAMVVVSRRPVSTPENV